MIDKPRQATAEQAVQDAVLVQQRVDVRVAVVHAPIFSAKRSRGEGGRGNCAHR